VVVKVTKKEQDSVAMYPWPLKPEPSAVRRYLDTREKVRARKQRTTTSSRTAR
jgi:hypothetical protein